MDVFVFLKSKYYKNITDSLWLGLKANNLIIRSFNSTLKSTL